jgi:hypothetical protein
MQDHNKQGSPPRASKFSTLNTKLEAFAGCCHSPLESCALSTAFDTAAPSTSLPHTSAAGSPGLVAGLIIVTHLVCRRTRSLKCRLPFVFKMAPYQRVFLARKQAQSSCYYLHDHRKGIRQLKLTNCWAMRIHPNTSFRPENATFLQYTFGV